MFQLAVRLRGLREVNKSHGRSPDLGLGLGVNLGPNQGLGRHLGIVAIATVLRAPKVAPTNTNEDEKNRKIDPVEMLRVMKLRKRWKKTVVPVPRLATRQGKRRIEETGTGRGRRRRKGTDEAPDGLTDLTVIGAELGALALVGDLKRTELI